MDISDNTTARGRVEIEADELAVKIEKLSEFCETGAFQKLHRAQRELLSIQLPAMCAYLHVLQARLENWEAPHDV